MSDYTAEVYVSGYGSTAVNATRRNKLEQGLYDASAEINRLIPAGCIAYYPKTTPPSGWLYCNGGAVSRTTYSALFSIIGTTFGAGDGSTTFNLPDIRGIFVRGVDSGRGLDTSRTLGSYQADDFKQHTHPLTEYSINGSSGGSGSSIVKVTGRQTLNTQNYGDPETRPKNVALIAIIKVG